VGKLDTTLGYARLYYRWPVKRLSIGRVLEWGQRQGVRSPGGCCRD